MSREIKFRGKRVDNGEWVYGSLVNGTHILETGCEILPPDWEPDYNSSGMGCGLEDRRITDRYQAMEHGFEKCCEKYGEMMPVFHEVIPETVGQYVGIKDINDTEIYEGDKVVLFLNGLGKEKDEYSGTVIFKDGSFWIDNLFDKKYNVPKCDYLPHNSMLISQPELYEVTGKDYISNYGEVFTFSDNAMFVEVIGDMHTPNHIRS